MIVNAKTRKSDVLNFFSMAEKKEVNSAIFFLSLECIVKIQRHFSRWIKLKEGKKCDIKTLHVLSWIEKLEDISLEAPSWHDHEVAAKFQELVNWEN